MDENKLIAAILCAQTILLEDVASDPIVKTVDFLRAAARRTAGAWAWPPNKRRSAPAGTSLTLFASRGIVHSADAEPQR